MSLPEILIGLFIGITIIIFLGIGIFILAKFFDLYLNVEKLKNSLLKNK